MSRPEIFRAHFESLNGSAPPWVRRLRSAAMQRFTDLGFPTTRLEDWKYTDVSRIAETPFRMPASTPSDAADRVAAATCDGAARLVFVNGRYCEALSPTSVLPNGAQVMPLSRAFENEDLERHLASLADLESESFTALNTAFLQDGAYIRIEKGTIVEPPIHLLFLSSASGEPFASHPRVLIIAEPGSEATVIEDYVGDGAYFTNAVTEIAVGPDAKIDHYRLQRESAE
jgi:Fe-S cluster assembly protein SufD